MTQGHLPRQPQVVYRTSEGVNRIRRQRAKRGDPKNAERFRRLASAKGPRILQSLDKRSPKDRISLPQTCRSVKQTTRAIPIARPNLTLEGER